MQPIKPNVSTLLSKKALRKLKKSKRKVSVVTTEFKEFLKEYKIMGIAAGLVIGSAVTTLTTSLVAGLITPALQLLIPSEAVQGLTFPVGKAVFKIGDIVNALINFIIIALLFFLFAKYFLGQEKVTKDSLK